MDTYATPEHRTSKKDLKRKSLYNKYKRGGSLRVISRIKDDEKNKR